MSNFFLDHSEQAHLAGGKGKNLIALQKANFSIPPFVILSPETQNTVDFSAVITELEALTSHWPGKHFAVRSSALDEDSAEHSFAGQFATVLGVPIDNVEQAIKQVWASAESEQVQQYRSEHGLGSANQKPAVIIQALIPAQAAGVAFSKDPINLSANHTVISAVYGLGETLVDGSEDASNYWVTEKAVVRCEPAQQRTAKQFINGTVASVPTTAEQQKTPPLSDAQANDIAQLCQQAEEYFGAPQDIEWALHDGKLWLLQSRNITTLDTTQSGEFRLWDNSNIAESYSGITTPLTFSFARYVYEGVYRQFSAILGIRQKKILENEVALRSMLGLHAGRIYYNMNSWYQVLAMVPGFQFNHKMMEQMMGVKEGLPPELADALSQTTIWTKLVDVANLARTLVRLIWLNTRLPSTIKIFNRRFESALAECNQVAELNLEESVHAYHQLENKLLRAWDAPLINDFFAMIFVGVLAKLCDKWLNNSAIHSALLTANGNIVSAEPAQRIAQMAELIRGNEEWINRLASGERNAIEQALTDLPELNEQLKIYLDKFADRCLGELKLESLTLRDDPTTLYLAIAAQAKTTHQNTQRQPEPNVSQLVAPLGKVKQKLFVWVLKQARARVRDRENLRFERTRLFGRVRALLLNIGKHLAQNNKLAHARDIFYLDIQEVTGLVDATQTVNNLKALVELRKTEFEKHQQTELPDRFETRGATLVARRISREPVPEFSDHLKGTGACPGIVKAQVRVVTDPANANMQPGEILVAQQTDPGWVMLFPMASGLLVERGSLLSHSAIVARELNLPAVVSIPQLLSQLTTGDWVMMNGQTGEVWKLDTPVQASTDSETAEQS